MDDERLFFRGLTAGQLRYLAMLFMLCDHAWALLFPACEALTCIGRLAFPIFAFLIAEGARHTHDINKYIRRMFFWALVTEVPFNLMLSGSMFYPVHQNVMFTFVISLLCIKYIEKARASKFSPTGRGVIQIIIAVLGFCSGYLLMVDYYGVGVLNVLLFYYLSGRNWTCKALQAAGMIWLHWELMGGYFYEFILFGHEFMVFRQGLAVLALAFIWAYNGREVRHGRAERAFRYGFYPAHMLLLRAAYVLMT